MLQISGAVVCFFFFLSLRTFDPTVSDLCELNQSSVVALCFSSLSSEAGCHDNCFWGRPEKCPLVHQKDSEGLHSAEQTSVPARNLLHGPLCEKPDILQADSSKSLRISGWLGDYGYYSSPNLKQQMKVPRHCWLMLDGQPLHPSCTESWRYSRFCR